MVVRPFVNNFAETPVDTEVGGGGGMVGVGKRPENGGRGEEGRRGRGAREEKQEERKEGSKKWNMEKEELQEGNGVNRMVE